MKNKIDKRVIIDITYRDQEELKKIFDMAYDKVSKGVEEHVHNNLTKKNNPRLYFRQMYLINRDYQEKKINGEYVHLVLSKV
jgi:hypothetical protein